MNWRRLEIPDVILFEPGVFRDHRGEFVESGRADVLSELAGKALTFVQTNVSVSRRGVLRGLHYQRVAPQGKLVSVADGAVTDVIVDLRRGSRTFGEWLSVDLHGIGGGSLWVPPGFAHGFLVRSETAIVTYACTTVYDPSEARALNWASPDLAIVWRVDPADVRVSEKDGAAPRLSEIAPGDLPCTS